MPYARYHANDIRRFIQCSTVWHVAGAFDLTRINGERQRIASRFIAPATRTDALTRHLGLGAWSQRTRLARPVAILVPDDGQ